MSYRATEADVSVRRVDIKAILRDPKLRRRLLATSLQAIQAREGRDLSLAEAYEVVDRVGSFPQSSE